jgi:hypothetical protein
VSAVAPVLALSIDCAPIEETEHTPATAVSIDDVLWTGTRDHIVMARERLPAMISSSPMRETSIRHMAT